MHACLPAQSLQLCPTLCDPMDCCLPGSSVHGILQARILEWVAMPPPGDFPSPGFEPASLASPVLQVDSLPTEPPGKPQVVYMHTKFWNLASQIKSQSWGSSVIKWPSTRPIYLAPEKFVCWLELHMEQWTGSKAGKEHIKVVYYHLTYLTHMQSTSCERLKLESRLPGEISITSDR